MTLCACGCGKEIITKQWHKYRNIKYIKGHSERGKHLSEEIKIKMRSNQPNRCGKNNPMYGKHHTKETKEKMKKPKSEEHKRKMSENHANFSDENHPMWGKHHTQESKNKISNGLLGKYSGKNNPMYGKLPSIKTNRGKRFYYNSPRQGEIYLRSSYELAYVQYLDSINELWYYEIETFDLGDSTYTPDFFLPRIDKFVEIKGYMLPKYQEKINKFLEQYPWDLEILRKDDLKRLGCNIK